VTAYRATVRSEGGKAEQVIARFKFHSKGDSTGIPREEARVDDPLTSRRLEDCYPATFQNRARGLAAEPT